MKKQISDISSGNGKQVEFDGLGFEVTLTGVGLALPKLKFEQWMKLAPVFRMGRLNEDLNRWRIADWLAYGSNEYCERDAETGRCSMTPMFSRYKEVMESTGYSDGECQLMVAVARSVPRHVRYAPMELTFAHHVCVVDLAEVEQVKLLRAAKEHAWSVSDLRSAVRAAQSDQDKQQALPMVVGINLLGIAAEIERTFNLLQRKQPIEQWPEEQRAAVKRDAIRIRTFLDLVVARL